MVRISKCRSCGDLILWVKTVTGKNMPVDHDPDIEHYWDDGQDVEFDPGSMTSHFSTCKYAEQHRRR